MRRRGALVVLTLAAACAGEQSALAPEGPEAERIALLYWIMIWGGGAIFAAVIALAGIALFGPARWKKGISQQSLVIAGGIAFPIVVLTALLFYGFSALRAGEAASIEEPSLRVTITGEQWWWRVVYLGEEGRRVESANELRIPAGEPVEITLESADVIHSFWIPAYAGKVDMIPGRTTRLHLRAAAPGVARGQCAEYCGGAHALMSFYAVALPLEEFDAWFAAERSDAAGNGDSAGARLFEAAGCGSCHTVRGHGARGRIGPDLTHVGSRLSLGAGVLDNDLRAFERWIGAHQAIKPDSRMPPFEVFTASERRALAIYLDGLD